jgi:molybdopterin-containing oxidoreductase family iron-sulfur binding subunit
VLSEPFSSPTLARLAAAMRERFPGMRWASWAPVTDENLYAGVERAVGRALQPVRHLDRASVILALDADPLLTETDAVRQARGFAAARRVGSAPGPMSRLWVVEGALSLTGANADHRLRLPSRAVAGFLLRLAQELGRRGLDVRPPAAGGGEIEIDGAWLSALADDLLAQRARGAILAGRRQPPEVHATALALDAALGNLGHTVTLHEAPHALRSSASELAALVTAMRGGAVRTLVLVGGNPVYDAPADLDFAGALSGVAEVIHLGSRLDETGRRASWHLPSAHFLEGWGDAAALDGTPSVVQPLIAPLYGGRTAVELLALLAHGEERSGHETVRETWRGLLGEEGFEKRWARVLHDGLLRDAAPAPVEVVVAAEPRALDGLAGARAAEGLEVVFQASPALLDGRFANNGWLQELPDPVTKLTWDNAVLVSPATAHELGLETGDVAELTYRERQIEMPVFVVPGQADGTVVLPLGWGRRGAGRVGDGRGFDVYVLRTTSALDFDGGLRLARVGETYPLATTQDHHTLDELGQEERDARAGVLLREGTLETFHRHPEFAKELVEHPPLRSLWQEPSYDRGHQWGMSIDLNACTGCNACVVACQSENNIPVVGKEQVSLGREMHWIRVDRYFRGGTADPQAAFQPVPCMHCENAPCEQVCPVAATVHDEEGLNAMAYNRCIGTRYCLNNCPYKVRRFNYFNFTKRTPEVTRLGHNPDVTIRSRGVMEKCTFCTQRINETKIRAKLDGRAVRDGEIQPACQQACPTGAIVFGDLRDAESAVVARKRDPRDYAMLAELNNKPRTTYLAKLRNPHPSLAAPSPSPTPEAHG